MDDIITKEEQEALVKFRQRIPDLFAQFTDYQKHDIWLLRWLRARDLSQSKAEDMLRKSLKWREDRKMEEILDWVVPDYINVEFLAQSPGLDKDGCIVTITPFGKWDIKKACGKGYKDDLSRFVGQLFENLMKYLESRTTPQKFLYQFVIILDFEGFSLTQLASKQTIDLYLEILRNFEANYPETLKNAWVVNAPKYFEVLFAIVKPILSAKTISKIHIHGTSGYRELLLKTVDPDQLPSQYGGSITTVQDYRVRYGFLEFPVYETFREEEMAGIELAAGMKHMIHHHLPIGTTMSWNFRTLDYDIGYSIEFVEEGQTNAKILFSCEKADAHLHVQKGAILAENAGTYTLILNNSNSRFRGKKIYFGVRLKSDG